MLNGMLHTRYVCMSSPSKCLEELRVRPRAIGLAELLKQNFLEPSTKICFMFRLTHPLKMNFDDVVLHGSVL